MEKRLIDTPDFWRRVKADFESADRFYCICDTSLVFRAEWYSSENFNIRDLTHDFLRESDKYDVTMYGDKLRLFDVDDATLEFNRALRLDFLDYMIEKTSTHESYWQARILGTSEI